MTNNSGLWHLLSGKAPDWAVKDYGLDLLADFDLLPTEAQLATLRRLEAKIETDSLGFGNTYALARKHMATLYDIKTVVDIGCAWGIFSYLFGGYNYIGIEEYEGTQFCQYFDHHSVIYGAFPFTTVKGDCFIASMSLGYGGRLYREGESAHDLLVERLGLFKYGYYEGDQGILDKIATVFHLIRLSDNSKVPPRYKSMEVYFLERKGK